MIKHYNTVAIIYNQGDPPDIYICKKEKDYLRLLQLLCREYKIPFYKDNRGLTETTLREKCKQEDIDIKIGLEVTFYGY